MIYNSKSPEDTLHSGLEFAKELKTGDIIGLDGELGSGKTQFVKGIGKYYSVEDIINSPTFILVNEYEGKDPANNKSLHINHFDLYRIEKTFELSVIGFEDYINENSIVLIEWSKCVEEYLGRNIRKVKFGYGEEQNERVIEF